MVRSNDNGTFRTQTFKFVEIAFDDSAQLGDRERLFGYLEGNGKQILSEPHALGAEGGAEQRGDGAGGEDVRLLRLESLDARLLLLLAQDDEGPSILVED